MIQKIQTDLKKLMIPCTPCSFKTKEDKALNETIIQDMIDTCQHLTEEQCWGLAANQIGYNKRIIVILHKKTLLPLINPEPLFLKSQGYKTDWERCLSWIELGNYRVRRYKSVKITFKNFLGHQNQRTFKGLTARIIQHELDHLNGIIRVAKK